tara:strand:- start:1193 stop:1582 length:390 start_codon:yes stop_codon:yes gene_type:complete
VDYLADTITIIRYFSKTGEIGNKAKSILDATDKGGNHIFVSVISLVEIMYLAEKRRIKVNLHETVESINYSINYSIVELSSQIVMIAEATFFPELHDRLIIATAKYLKIPILTGDKKILKTDAVSTIWK